MGCAWSGAQDGERCQVEDLETVGLIVGGCRRATCADTNKTEREREREILLSVHSAQHRCIICLENTTR